MKGGPHCVYVCLCLLADVVLVSATLPFPQIDIIGAMVIVWNVRGLFCAILCVTIVHSAMHTHMKRPNSSLDWVLSHWAHFTVLRFIFMVALCNRADHIYFHPVVTRRRSSSFAEYCRHFVARLNDVHAFGYNSAVSERIRMNFWERRDYCLELSWTNFGRDPRRSGSGRASRIFVFFVH